MPQDFVWEVFQGNKYTLTVEWGDDEPYCVYAGVLQADDFDDDTGTIQVRHKELRAALASDRMTFGVNQYAPAGTFYILDKSLSGATREVLTRVQAPSSEWVLPIDLPADGAGSYRRRVRDHQTLTFEDLLADIEARGAEIDFNPYIAADGRLRYETRVASKVQTGSFTDLAVGAPGGIVSGLRLSRDFSKQYTGVLGIGNGTGADMLVKYAPTSGSGAVDRPVKDKRVSFKDITDADQLQAATTAAYEESKGPTIQWSLDLFIWGMGPEFTDVGRRLRLWRYGSEMIPDGAHDLRVIALSGDMGFFVTPEVQA